jgi:nitrilase
MPLVGAAQIAPAFLDLAASVAIAERWIAKAGRQGLQLLVFPETWLPGYPVWLDNADAAAAWGSADAKALFRRLYENSPAVDSPEVARLCAAARAASTMVVMGMNERCGRTLYNTMLYISSEGRVLGKHRKLVPTYTERLVHGRGDGSTLAVVEAGVALGRVGGLVCWEHWMPLARQAMHGKLETVHAAVWPTVNELHQLASRSYAFEGRTFVVAAGSILRREHLPAGGSFALLDAMDGEVFQRGGSAIIGPDGEYLAGPVYDTEGLVVGEVDLGRIAEELQTLDVCGHYGRADVFQLAVDERKQVLMTTTADAVAAAPPPPPPLAMAEAARATAATATTTATATATAVNAALAKL